MFLTTLMKAPSEQLWAEHGLTGLVLCALFTLIGVFLRVLTKKDKTHQCFLQDVLEADRTERVEARKEHATVNKQLAGALNGLTIELEARRQQFDSILKENSRHGNQTKVHKKGSPQVQTGS